MFKYLAFQVLAFLSRPRQMQFVPAPIVRPGLHDPTAFFVDRWRHDRLSPERPGEVDPVAGWPWRISWPGGRTPSRRS
jgi:hypothetical protein